MYIELPDFFLVILHHPCLGVFSLPLCGETRVESSERSITPLFLQVYVHVFIADHKHIKTNIKGSIATFQSLEY